MAVHRTIEGWKWTLLLTAPVALFVCFFSMGWDMALGDPVPLSTVIVSYLVPTAVALWVLRDAQRRDRSLPYDFGSFVFFTWQILVPLYLFRTRGWRALLVIGGFGLVYGLATWLGYFFGQRVAG